MYKQRFRNLSINNRPRAAVVGVFLLQLVSITVRFRFLSCAGEKERSFVARAAAVGRLDRVFLYGDADGWSRVDVTLNVKL